MRLPIVHKIYYSWTGWPKTGLFPPAPDDSFMQDLDADWQRDGLRHISSSWNDDKIQITVRSCPQNSAATIAARVKGRLDHHLRRDGWSGGFRRKVGMRTLGGNSKEQVLRYIAKQLERSGLVDPRYVGKLAQVAWENPNLDLSIPLASCRGRYWNDFHMVVVARNRARLGSSSRILAIRSGVLEWNHLLVSKIPNNQECGLKSFSLMPDHLHLAARLPVETNPEEAASGLLRLLNKAAGNAYYSERIYIGSFSVYSINCVFGVT